MGLFRRLFGAKNKDKKTSRSSNSTPSVSHKFHDAQHTLFPPYDASLDSNKHAIAVAAATAAVAEAALAAAQAAAEVVRLTNAGAVPTANVAGSRRRWQEELAAIRIQSAFRGYLARRALKALKALVKLQALVRGHIVRKQTSDMLRRMQTLVRVQARARASRTHMSDSWHSTSKGSISQYAYVQRSCSNANFRDIIDRDKSKLRWLDNWMEDSLWNNHESSSLTTRHTDDEKSDKILEVDTWMPRVKSHQGNRSIQMPHVLASDHGNQNFVAFDSSSKLPKKMPNPMPKEEVLPLNRLKLPLGSDETVCRTAGNSPHAYSASSRPGSNSRKSLFTPTRSEYSWGFFNGYSGYPNYMANTESSRAKVRSQSAPRQRLEIDKYGLTKRSFQGYGDTDTHSEMGFTPYTHFRNKAHKASGYLNRLEDTGFR